MNLIKLPDLVLNKIFNHLNVAELIKIRRVCKQFDYLINQIKFQKLIVKRLDDVQLEGDDNCWYNTNEPIDTRTIIYRPWKIEIYNYYFNFDSFIQIFEQLKYLKINLLNSDFCLWQVNCFTKLEHLEVNVEQLEIDEKIELNLPNLKLLKIGTIKNYHITINSTKLKFLICYELDQLKIMNPSTIENLTIEEDRLKILKLKKYSNLKIFTINDFSWLDSTILDQLPDYLDEMHLHYPFHSINKCLIDKVKLINNHKLKMNKFRNLKIYFLGIELNRRSIDDYEFDKGDRLDLLFRNYDYLETNLSWYSCINYNRLIDKFNHKISINSFFNKFNNIQYIFTTQLVNQDKLSLFLSNCPNLSRLEFNYSNLDQKFLNNLPYLCRLIQFFKLYDNENFDFNFIRKLTILKCLDLNQNLTIEMIKHLIDELEFIICFKFKLNNKSIRIDREHQNLFKISNHKNEWYGLSNDKLINHCYRLEYKNSNKRIKLN